MIIEDLNDALGGYAWLQRNLADALHSWRGAESDAEVATFLHSTARRFEQHSAGWEALLADSPALAASERVRPPSPGWEQLFDGAATETAERLVVLIHVVLPRMLTSLERFAGHLGEVSEAEEQRFCAAVTTDLRAQQSRGVALLDQRTPAPSQRRLSAALGRRLADLSC
ncbi:MAG: hypothetical protein J4F99_04860 [Acidimicrobiia bacterium]|nr:hypothetical protein [Acidimicrobiia bacterium]